MDINRNNYEEYFLLYADNELTDSEKAQVLMFLKDNKDLEEEFRMIHHTICKPEAAVGLSDKSFLLKGNEAPIINAKNYEEVFVLYHDNELTGKEKNETENFVSQYPQLKNEFELIGLARLTPEDAVVFPNKKILYRKERTGKVVPIIFWRALAAAIFLGAGLWVTQLYTREGQRIPGTTAHSVPVKQVAPVKGIDKIVPGKKPENNLVKSQEQPAKSSKREMINKKEKLFANAKINSSSVAKNEAKTQKPVKALTNQAEEKNNEKVNNNEAANNEVVVTNEQTKNLSKEQIDEEDNRTKLLKESDTNIAEESDNIEPVKYAQNTSYISDPNNNAQNYVFYDITTEKFKKTKMGGFLKKVKRVIQRNNPISRLLSGDEGQVVSK